MVERVKTLALLDECVALSGFKFFDEGSIPGRFVPEIFRENWIKILGTGFGAMWVSKHDNKAVGALGALIHPDINDNELVASEAFWYVLPEHRGKLDSIRLFQHFEKWAIKRNAMRMQMTRYLSTATEKLDRFYDKNGYKPIETVFVKDTRWQ